MRDCGLANERLWNPNIWDYLYYEMKNLLVTKGLKEIVQWINFLGVL
jgi:hypothetical protein